MNSLTEATLKIDDMACSGCSDSIQKALSALEGVEEVHAAYESGTANVSYNSKQVSETDFEQAVEEAGYSFNGMA